MKRILHLWIIGTLIFNFSSTRTGNKETIIKCFKAIENNNFETVKELVHNGLDVNSVLDLNDDYFEYCKVVGESECTILAFARYHNALKIYYFLTLQEGISLTYAGFLPLKTGSLLPLNEDGSINKENKNFYPINHELWPKLQPIVIKKDTKCTDLMPKRWCNKN